MNPSKLGQKIGILGGGQLGKMLCQAGSNMCLDIRILENDYNCPASFACNHIVKGDITSYEDVLAFGSTVDIITVEIENVNIEALEELEKMGKKVYPQAGVLKMIKDKGKQKIFYEGSGFPTADFTLFKNKQKLTEALSEGVINFPFVQKLRTEGYDGKGVMVVRNESDLENALEGTCLVENMISIEKEISVIVARNPAGDIKTFPVVEMNFHPVANLVEYLFCPSSISYEQAKEAEQLAVSLAETMDVIGLLAVEMFIDEFGKLLINEVAPRPHNSGHHTIEACATSQYAMHLKSILDLPLSDTTLIRPAVMLNLLGEEGCFGEVIYFGIENCLKIDGVYPHLYGKKETRPYRKMGHVTVVDQHLPHAIEKAKIIQKSLKVISL